MGAGYTHTIPLGLGVSVVVTIDPRTVTASAIVREDYYGGEVAMGGDMLTMADAMLKAWFFVVSETQRVGEMVRQYVMHPAWTVREWREAFVERLEATFTRASEVANAAA